MIIKFLAVLVCLSLSDATTKTYELRCGSSACLLESKQDGNDGQIKVGRTVCVDEACSSSLVVSDSKHLFECQLDFILDSTSASSPLSSSSLPSSKPLGGQCQKLTETPVGEALVRLGLNEIAEAQVDELPAETMNYHKNWRRQMPFETLNYGKRSSGLPSNSILVDKKNLPIDIWNYGKRSSGLDKKSLPIDIWNYGKRAAYVPIDGYIIGKRED